MSLTDDTLQFINSQYRTRARQIHPDRSPLPTASRDFAELSAEKERLVSALSSKNNPEIVPQHHPLRQHSLYPTYSVNMPPPMSPLQQTLHTITFVVSTIRSNFVYFLIFIFLLLLLKLLSTNDSSFVSDDDLRYVSLKYSADSIKVMVNIYGIDYPIYVKTSRKHLCKNKEKLTTLVRKLLIKNS
ncbi:hypothetical protein RCL1_005746 [Eukaryota sp. TZLM3-RCL]